VRRSGHADSQSNAALAKRARTRPIDLAGTVAETLRAEDATPVADIAVWIDGWVEKKDGFRHGPLRSLRSVGKGRDLRFKLVTDAPSRTKSSGRCGTTAPRHRHRAVIWPSPGSFPCPLTFGFLGPG
jgi:hypothetical protein